MIFCLIGIIGIGVWAVADGVSSLYTYTGNNPKAQGQSFWRDHSLRILRIILGITQIVLACLVIGYLMGKLLEI